MFPVHNSAVLRGLRIALLTRQPALHSLCASRTVPNRSRSPRLEDHTFREEGEGLHGHNVPLTSLEITREIPVTLTGFPTIKPPC